MSNIKQSDYTAFSPGVRGLTLHDLYREIERDTSLSSSERRRIIQQIQSAVPGGAPGTPLSAVLSRGLGGTLGYLISKYFGMGGVGRAVSTALGYGLGKVVHDKLAPPRSAGTGGWRIL